MVCGIISIVLIRQYVNKTTIKATPLNAETILQSIKIFNVDHLLNTPLHIAAKNNHHMIAIYCLNCISTKAGVSSWGDFDKYINAQNSLGQTALHIAADNNSLDVCDILLRNRAANINAIDYLGRTPLHLAIDKNYALFVEKLLQKNANIEIVDRMGRSPKQSKMVDNFLKSRI